VRELVALDDVLVELGELVVEAGLGHRRRWVARAVRQPLRL